jgi:PTH1 family peptidyl-tRNA hydrolase
MTVVAGLGNPGREYASTPHSIGFEAVDALARRVQASWKSSAQFKGNLAKCEIRGKKAVLVKPGTFMNLSGECVAPVAAFYKVPPEELIVVSDDIDLPSGRIRIRRGGSAGGHNGLKSVMQHLGTDGFTRIRVGVGRAGRSRSEVVGHVLGKIPAEERKILDEAVEAAADAVESVIENGLEYTMNRFNGWSAPSAAAAAGEENK